MTKCPVCNSSRYHFNLDDSMTCGRCGYRNSNDQAKLFRFLGAGKKMEKIGVKKYKPKEEVFLTDKELDRFLQ